VGAVLKPWADLPLTRKGLVVVAVPLIILIGSLFTLYRASQTEARAEADVRRAFAIQRDIYQVHALLAEAASGVRGYLLTGQGRFLEPYEKADRELAATLMRLDIAIEDEGVRAAYDVFLDLADQKRAGLETLLALDRQGPPTDGLTEEAMGLLVSNKRVLDDLRRQIGVIQRLEGRLLDARRERVDRVRSQYLLLTAISAAIGILGSLAAVTLFSTGIVRRVHLLEGNAELLQQGLPLAPFPPASDEIGRLAGKLDRASDLLRAREQDLKQSEERFRLVVEGVQDYGIFALTPKGRVATWNAGAERIKGYRAEEILGEHFSRFYPEETRDFLPARMLARASANDTAEDEGWRVRKDGSRFWANVVITALRDEEGRLQGFAKVTRDITERKQTEEALRIAREEAVAANLAKSEFLSRTSHELRTPMSAILGFTQVLELDQEELSGPHRKAVTQISKAARHLLSLIDDLLDISSIEAGSDDLLIEPADLNSLLSEAHGLSAPLIQAAGLRFEFSAAETQPVVLCDHRRAVQVVLNLLANAAKYNQGGEFVRLEAGLEDGRAVVRVSDDGPGIPEGHLPRLFTPFDRLGRERKKGVEGSGLGLALSKRLVESMNGSIGVDTEPGRGASFWFTLPLRAGLEPSAAAKPPQLEHEVR
jgi:PAS domain S-box-containing protein